MNFIELISSMICGYWLCGERLHRCNENFYRRFRLNFFFPGWFADVMDDCKELELSFPQGFKSLFSNFFSNLLEAPGKCYNCFMSSTCDRPRKPLRNIKSFIQPDLKDSFSYTRKKKKVTTDINFKSRSPQ